MDPRHAPFVIASHWPYLDRQLELSRSPALRRALRLLAERQVVAEGEPVLLGRARLRELDFTAGEAQRVAALFRELEAKRVLSSRPGRGSAPAAWSFLGDLSHWRGLPWRTSPRSASAVVFGCATSRICGAPLAFVDRFPDQRGRGSPAILLAPADHLHRPGLLPVDSLHNGESRSTNASPRHGSPVETHQQTEELDGALSYSSFTTDRRANYLGKTATSHLSVSEEQRLAKLQAALRAAGGDAIWERTRHFPALVELTGYNDAQVDLLASIVRDGNRGRALDHRMKPPKLLELAQRAVATSPAFAALADRVDVDA